VGAKRQAGPWPAEEASVLRCTTKMEARPGTRVLRVGEGVEKRQGNGPGFNVRQKTQANFRKLNPPKTKETRRLLQRKRQRALEQNWIGGGAINMAKGDT